MPIPVHIGDWSAPRSGVQVFCPKPECRAVFLSVLVGSARFVGLYQGQYAKSSEANPRAGIWEAGDGEEESNEFMVVADTQEEGPWAGQAFLFIVTPPHAIATDGPVLAKGEVAPGFPPDDIAVLDQLVGDEPRRRQEGKE